MARRLYIGDVPTNLVLEEGDAIASAHLAESALKDSLGDAGEDGQVLAKQDGKFVWTDPVDVGGGGGGSETQDFTAGENVNQYQGVYIADDGKAYKADAATLAHAGRVIGVATTSATTGNSLTVQTGGKVSNGGWSWTPGQPVYVGAVGALTQSVGTGVFQQQLGIAFSATDLELDIEIPIVLA